MDSTTAEFISEMTKALIWPLVLVGILRAFSAPLIDLLNNAKTGKFKAGDLEIEFERIAVASAALGAAEVQRNKSVEVTNTEGVVVATEPLSQRVIGNIATTMNKASQQSSKGSFGNKNVLWVDDKPRNNLYEQQALEAFGVKIYSSVSTEDALNQLNTKKYDLIISDLGRPGDPQAGYTLLNKKNNIGNQTPYILYTAKSNPQHKRESTNLGAFGLTNNPTELVQMALQALAK